MQQTCGLYILNENDERILGLTKAVIERGSHGMADFVCEPETETVIGIRTDGTRFPMTYGEFERWFVAAAAREPFSVRLMLGTPGPTEDDRLSAKFLVADLNGRIGADSPVERFAVDEAHDLVIEIGKDGSRRTVPLKGFVRLFTPRR